MERGKEKREEGGGGGGEVVVGVEGEDGGGLGRGENGVIRSWFSVCGGEWGRWGGEVQSVWFSGSDTDTVEGFVYRSSV